MESKSSPKQKRCLIYCRVSSQRQVNEGHGLDSQEQRCHDWAKAKGYVVEKVFPDDGVSGGLFDRPAMTELIQYLDKRPTENYVVVFDDLSRFARGLQVHLKLRSELMARGATLECLNYNFDESPEGMFIENVLASKNELDRQQNRRQVIQKQKARLELGYWCFCNPPALKYFKDATHGRLLRPEEPLASIYKEAIEKYGCDQLNTYDQVREFILSRYRLNGIDRKLSIRGVNEILSEILYTGYVEYKPWGVELRKGHHEGFVSMQTFINVQNKIQGKTKKHLRKDYNVDFSLRGFVVCPECQEPYTGSWSTGRRGKKYAHYWCKTKNCSLRYKTIKKKVIDDDFHEFLKKVKLGADCLHLAKAVLLDAWDERKNEANENRFSASRRAQEVENQLEALVKRISKTENELVIKTYESQLEKLSRDKAELEKTLVPSQFTQTNFGTAVEKVFKTLENPLGMWKSDNIEDKRTVLYMYFDQKLDYSPKLGFGTAILEPSISLIRDLAKQKSNLVEMRGIEPLF